MRAYERIYKVVNRIPRGRVATYGQVAALAGLPGHARQVGYALSAMPEGAQVAWHRVINAQGGISPRAEPHAVDRQRLLLKDEGVAVGPGGRVPLARFQWRSGRPEKSVRPENGPPPVADRGRKRGSAR